MNFTKHQKDFYQDTGVAYSPNSLQAYTQYCILKELDEIKTQTNAIHDLLAKFNTAIDGDANQQGLLKLLETIAKNTSGK